MDLQQILWWFLLVPPSFFSSFYNFLQNKNKYLTNPIYTKHENSGYVLLFEMPKNPEHITA